MQKLACDPQQVQNFYDRVHSDMIDKAIGVQLKIHPLRNLGLIKGDMNGLELGFS